MLLNLIRLNEIKLNRECNWKWNYTSRWQLLLADKTKILLIRSSRFHCGWRRFRRNSRNHLRTWAGNIFRLGLSRSFQRIDETLLPPEAQVGSFQRIGIEGIRRIFRSIVAARWMLKSDVQFRRSGRILQHRHVTRGRRCTIIRIAASGIDRNRRRRQLSELLLEEMTLFNNQYQLVVQPVPSMQKYSINSNDNHWNITNKYT